MCSYHFIIEKDLWESLINLLSCSLCNYFYIGVHLCVFLWVYVCTYAFFKCAYFIFTCIFCKVFVFISEQLVLLVCSEAVVRRCSLK